jgi:hypothetical protein
MASIIFRLDERSIKNGMVPVRLRISHKGTTAWHPTGVLVEPIYFNKDSLHEPISRKATMATYKREQLAGVVRQYEEGVFDLLRADGGKVQLEQMTASELRSYIFGERTRKQTAVQLVQKKKKTQQAADFMAFLDEYGKTKGVRTRENYEYVWRLVFEYLKARRLDGLSFMDLNYERLVDMKAWIRGTGRGEPTRFKMESYVRATYKEGLRRKMCSRDLDPYLDYKIEQVPEHDIVTISRKQVRQLMDVVCDGHPGMQRAKDVLLGSFYLCGINFQDMYNLPIGDEAVYIRQKVEKRTQKHIHVRVEPELGDIVSKYAGDGRMFNFAAGCRSLQYRLDDNFRELSKAVGFKVNMAIIRRTWATLAGELECPDYIINKSMGHIDRTVNGCFYRDYDWGLTAKWNRKVIDYVLAA